MAKVYITEYSKMLMDFSFGHPTPVPMEPPLAEQTVDITAGSVQSAAFNAETKFIRVHTDAICSRAIAVAPTATTSTARMAAGATEYIGITAGHKIAVITNT